MKVDFFIVGAPKAGTTSLYHYLNEHPEIEMSSQKETDFFSDLALQKQGLYYGKNRIDTLEKYHNLFPTQQEKKYGEASVSYLFYKEVPEKIKTYNNHGKIIIMLRNPTDRAFSHYLMDYRLGLINKPFESVLENENRSRKSKLFYQQYIELGLYFEQVKRYLDVFESTNVHIIFYQDFKNEIEEVIEKVYQFLGVDSSFMAEVGEKHNTFSSPKNNLIRKIYSLVFLRKLLNFIIPETIIKSIRKMLFKKDKKPELSLKLRAEINQIFAQDISLLETLLSEDLSRWKK
ncbi:MAG: sulfotransferase domain-containing protein [Flavobacteriales bacterium]|nr:sulfotransferase domain-containing protein [Flavobacteriales bacterium]